MSRSGLGGTPPRDSRRQVSRRAVLAAGAGILGTSLAGCTRISEFVAEYYVGDVNLFNISEVRLTGSLELADPDGEVLLDESLDLDPESDEEETEPAVVYEDVLTTEGPHRLDLHTEATGSDRAVSVSETVQVADPDAEKVVVIFAEELGEEFVTVSVVEDLSELEDDLEGA